MSASLSSSSRSSQVACRRGREGRWFVSCDSGTSMCRLPRLPIFADSRHGHKRELTGDWRTMRPTKPAIGVFLPTMGVAGADLARRRCSGTSRRGTRLRVGVGVDQLVAGTGAPALLDSIVALAAAAGATQRIALGLGVLVVPLRPVAWIAKQVASLQHVAGGRVLFGVGVGGDRHGGSWQAAGVARADHAARTDAALAVLPDLLAGRTAALPDVAGRPTVRLSPGVALPPLLIGGTARRRVATGARFADGWFAMPAPPAAVAGSVRRLAELAAEAGRDAPAVTGSIVVALDSVRRCDRSADRSRRPVRDARRGRRRSAGA